MTIFTDGLRMPGDRGIHEYESSTGEMLGASAVSAWEDSPSHMIAASGEISGARGEIPDFGDPTAALLYQEAFKPDEMPKISKSDAQAKVKEAGLEKSLTLPDRDEMNQAELGIMLDRARGRREREATLARGPSGFVPSALSVGTSLFVGAADPLNIAAAFIPVVGEARYGKLMADLGESIAGRMAVRAGAGAATGAAFTAGMQPLEWWSKTQEGQDFGMADALRNTVYGAGLFAGLHVAGGAASEIYRGVRGLPLSPAMKAIGDLPPRAQEDALRSSISSMIEGAPLRVGEMLDAAAKTDPRVAEAVDAWHGAPVEAPGAAPAADAVLARPAVKDAIDNLQIDRSHDVPYGAGADTGNPRLVHIDQHVPAEATINGKTFDPAEPVARHEIAEHEGMEADGMAYPDAHKTLGEAAEREWVEANIPGPNAWEQYTRLWDGWLSHIEHENPKNPPEGLYTKPYPHKEGEMLERRAQPEAPAAVPAARPAATPADAAGAWKSLAERRLPEDETDVVAASQAAQALPEPPSLDPNKRLKAALESEAQAGEVYAAMEPFLPEGFRAHLNDALVALEQQGKDTQDVLRYGAACLAAAGVGA